VVGFGLAMVRQAFQEVPRAHCVAVALGLIPLLAQWVLQKIVDLAVRTAGSDLLSTASRFGRQLAIYGLIAPGQGSLLTSMIWAASLVWMIERQFLRAARWLLMGAVCSCFGLIHAYQLTAAGVLNKLGWLAAPEFTLSYVAALFLLRCHRDARCHPDRFAT
jgi:adenine/guanine/hypoxanthine permease